MIDKWKSVEQEETAPISMDAVSFPDEVNYLEIIGNKLDIALRKAVYDIDRIDKEYMDTKRYMADYRGEIDPNEMFQNELALKQIDRTGAFAVGILEKLNKLRKSPYFGRIDFQTEETQIAGKYYIGRFSFSYEDEMLIFDWRAPIAGMYYDYNVGAAGYDAPMGRIEGNITLKRQLKVKDGVLEYALENSINIQDDVLQRELSHTSDEKMKSIISTIQKEQNKIIRNEKTETMIIQGVAGSGKTSVALHRIAFLLYRFKDKISARNIAILSPNKVFGDYISDVLPELGEEPIYEISIYNIAKIQLNGIIKFEIDKNHLEVDDAKLAARVQFKSTLDFVMRLNQYLENIDDTIFEPTDYVFGQFLVEADWIKNRFYTYRNYPVKKRLELIADDIHCRFDFDNFMADEVPSAKVVLKNLNKMMKIKNSLELYKNFYKWINLPDMFVLAAKQTLEWADVYPFLHLHAAFAGLQENKLTKHLIIDEMQDYTPIQYTVINRLFSCQKTILGDFGQSINPNHMHTLEDIQQIYRDGSFVELTKSYRSTYEIITFAKSIQQIKKLEPVERHGEIPLIISCMNWHDEIAKIKEKLDIFIKGKNVSLGIILKTNSAAQKFYKALAEEYEINLISVNSSRFLKGISITSIQMSKGLEFDEVIVPDVSIDMYKDEYDRNLLYIAATRAMHRLTLFYVEKPSFFLPIQK